MRIGAKFYHAAVVAVLLLLAWRGNDQAEQVRKLKAEQDRLVTVALSLFHSVGADAPTTYRHTAPAGLYGLPRVQDEPTVDSAVVRIPTLLPPETEVRRDSFDRRPSVGGAR